MHVTFRDVMGLRDGDSVVVRGMPIGKVKELKLAESESCSGVCVTLMLDNELTMHDGYEIKIISTSILGGRQLHIDEGPFDGEVVDLELYRGKDRSEACLIPAVPVLPSAWFRHRPEQ